MGAYGGVFGLDGEGCRACGRRWGEVKGVEVGSVEGADYEIHGLVEVDGKGISLSERRRSGTREIMDARASFTACHGCGSRQTKVVLHREVGGDSGVSRFHGKRTRTSHAHEVDRQAATRFIFVVC